MAAGSQATLPPGQASAKHGRTNLLFVVPYFLCSACASDLTPVQPLHESASINFAGSETQDIQFEVPTDRPILISVSARDVDVKATILRPDAAAGSYADAPNRRMGIETLLVEPPHDAAIALRLSRNDHRDARGIVTIKVIALPTITSADRTRLAAVRFEAAACISFPDPANGKESAEAFRSAADLNDRIGDLLKAGTALLHAAGARYARLDDWKSAAELAASAATRLQEVSAPALSAFALRVEGAALDQLANAMGQELKSRDRTANRARLRLTEAARGLEALGFTYEAGYALNYRGVSFLESGERERARADFGDALALFRAAHDEPAQALSLQSLAVLVAQ